MLVVVTMLGWIEHDYGIWLTPLLCPFTTGLHPAQQLESSRLKLAQLEQEFQCARK